MLEARYAAAGWWDGSTLPSILADALVDSGAQKFCVHSKRRPWEGSLADIASTGLRLAGGLHRLGLRPGDRVAFQLPNSAESAAAFYGLALLGAVLVPIDINHAGKDLQFILNACAARTVLISDRVGARVPLDEVNSIRPHLPFLDSVIVIGDEPVPQGALRFCDIVDGDALTEPARVDPASPAVIGWTSGTTAAPKGVILSHRALAAEIRLHMAPFLAARTRPLASTSPISHVTGMLVSVLVPPVIGQEVHLLDGWDPTYVLDLMAREKLSAGTGAPLFLASLLDHPKCTPEHLTLIEISQLGGAAVPPDLIRRADALGIIATRGYGCTEHPSISLGRPTQTLEERATTDGIPCPGVEVRIVDHRGNDLPPGVRGDILTRGPDLFSGYTDPELTADAFDTGGWFRTGDIGIVDENGCLSVVGRSKDIVIRSGMNISTAEVEAALIGMDGVNDVAVVAVPDARTGERGFAFLRVAPGIAPPNLEQIRSYLATIGMAKYKWPESIRVMREDFPRTPAGKVRKNVLRESFVD
ncbi:AMP-binding protein [Rhodococcus wratislaviensis]|nr:AMP-binding protein [Rhodococcus wratislaviensis]